MALWRIFKVLLAAFLLFVLINFFLSNLDPKTGGALGQEVSFLFNLPPLINLKSVPFPLAYLLLASFVLGMLLAAMMGGLNALGNRKKIKIKNKEIKILEKEIKKLQDSQPAKASSDHFGDSLLANAQSEEEANNIES